MRKLKTCTTVCVGGHSYKEGTVLTEKEAHPTLVAAADTGRKINGILLAVWLTLATPEVKPEPAPAPVVEPAPEEVIEVQGGEVAEDGTVTAEVPELPTVEALGEAPELEAELATFIKSLVAAGDTKTAIIEELGRVDQWTQDGVRAEFNRLLDAGEILRGNKPGEYHLA